MQQLAVQLSAAAGDSQTADAGDVSLGSRVMETFKLRENSGREQATAALATRLDHRIRESTNALIEIHQLEGSAGGIVLERVQKAYAVQEPIPEGRAALLGGVLTGALAGLKADLATGGLSMGAGLLVGALVGGLGGAGVARGINRITGTERTVVAWDDEFLDGLARSGVLRYLAVAHYGRGRGQYVEGEAPAFWHGVVDAAVRQRSEAFHTLWHRARHPSEGASVAPALASELSAITLEVLDQLYPRQLPAQLQRRSVPAPDR